MNHLTLHSWETSLCCCCVGCLCFGCVTSMGSGTGAGIPKLDYLQMPLEGTTAVLSLSSVQTLRGTEGTGGSTSDCVGTTLGTNLGVAPTCSGSTGVVCAKTARLLHGAGGLHTAKLHGKSKTAQEAYMIHSPRSLRRLQETDENSKDVPRTKIDPRTREQNQQDAMMTHMDNADQDAPKNGVLDPAHNCLETWDCP